MRVIHKETEGECVIKWGGKEVFRLLSCLITLLWKISLVPVKVEDQMLLHICLCVSVSMLLAVCVCSCVSVAGPHLMLSDSYALWEPSSLLHLLCSAGCGLCFFRFFYEVCVCVGFILFFFVLHFLIKVIFYNPGCFALQIFSTPTTCLFAILKWTLFCLSVLV